MQRIWQKIRNKVCPKRIYKWGTVGLAYNDDRSRLEKICDTVDEYFYNRRQMQRYRKANRKQSFHSFFDVSTDQWITSAKQIDEIRKKKGLEFMSFREIEYEAKRYRKINEAEAKRQIRKDMGEAVRQIAQGRSFVKETKQKIREGHYEIGKRETFNKQ